jgi:hypothetical protein
MPRGAVAVWLAALFAASTPRDGGAAEQPRPSPEPAAVAQIRVEPSRAEPRAGERLEVSLWILGAGGLPVDGEVALDCDLGEVGPVVQVGPGRYRASLTAPRVIPGTRSLLLLARAGGSSAEATLPLSAGPAASIVLSGPAAARADGASSVWLEAILYDAFGNAAEDVPAGSARLGQVRPARSTGPGRWELEYVPGRHLDEAVDLVAVGAGSARATHRLRLTAPRSWGALAPWAGVVSAQGTGAAFAAGADAAWWWRGTPGALGVGVHAAWWRLDDADRVALPGGAAALAGTRSYVPVTAALAWGHRLGGRAEAWLAAGAGAAHVSASQRLAGQPAISEAGWGPAATAGAALGVRAWRGLPFVEVRGVWIGDADLVTVSGPSRAVLLLAGYRFDAR